MRKSIIFLFVFLIVVGSGASGIGEGSTNPENNKKMILPYADFAINFCNFPYAWTVSRGRGVKVGLLYKDAPVFDPDMEAGHGTWMARDLVKVAPGVKIMPVRFCGNGIFGDADLYIKGIEYAAANGADVISISHQPIPRNKQKEVDSAVAKAAEKNVVLVYIHYRGERDEVVVSNPVEFAAYDRNNRKVYVIGTNFIDDSSFPFTWGFSQTAPIVSGVIAMMKEVNPKLTPLEINHILLKSVNKTPDGYPVLDAVKAVKKAKAVGAQ